MVVTEAIPNLTLNLPGQEMILTSPALLVSGQTDPGNRVTVNDTPMEVDPDGGFSGVVELPPGAVRLIATVQDPQGRSWICRGVKSKPTKPPSKH